MSDAQRADRLVARRLALAFFLFYALCTHGHFSGTDELTVFEGTQSLAERGNLAVSPAPCAHPGRGGRLHGCFAAGQSFLALPFYVTGKLSRTLLPGVWERRLGGPTMHSGRWSGSSVEIFAVTLYAPAASGLLVGLFFLFQRRLGISLRVALIAAALVGACSYVATQSVYFLRHTTEALAVLGRSTLCSASVRTGASERSPPEACWPLSPCSSAFPWRSPGWGSASTSPPR